MATGRAWAEDAPASRDLAAHSRPSIIELSSPALVIVRRVGSGSLPSPTPLTAHLSKGQATEIRVTPAAIDGPRKLIDAISAGGGRRPVPERRWEIAAGVQGHPFRGLAVEGSGSGRRVGASACATIRGTKTRVRGIIGANFEALVMFPWGPRAARRWKWRGSPVDGDPLTVWGRGPALVERTQRQDRHPRPFRTRRSHTAGKASRPVGSGHWPVRQVEQQSTLEADARGAA